MTHFFFFFFFLFYPCSAVDSRSLPAGSNAEPQVMP